MNRNNNHRNASGSASPHQAGNITRLQNPAAQINTLEIIRLINSTVAGSLRLRAVRDSLFGGVDPRSNAKFEQFERIWKHLLQNEENFILSDQSKDVKTLSGNETVGVRTVLTLCKTHIRRGKGGRNRTCDGKCKALHVCRTFLLCSENECPFNSKKKKCMFGHSFVTDHNMARLKAHNLYGLSDAELRKLFQRRHSRSANTLPQVCIYYNKADGKNCTREDCKSLHLCMDFVQQRCDGKCSRNHKLSTSQVQGVLHLFGIDVSYSIEMLLEDIRPYIIFRHVLETGSDSSGEDSDASESSEPGGHVAGGQARLASLVNVDTSASLRYFAGKSEKSDGCKDRRKGAAKMEQTISLLTSQMSNLKGTKSNSPSRPSHKTDQDLGRNTKSDRSSKSSHQTDSDRGQINLHPGGDVIVSHQAPLPPSFLVSTVILTNPGAQAVVHNPNLPSGRLNPGAPGWQELRSPPHGRQASPPDYSLPPTSSQASTRPLPPPYYTNNPLNVLQPTSSQASSGPQPFPNYTNNPLNVLPPTISQVPTSLQPFPYNTNNPLNVFPPTSSQAPASAQRFQNYTNNPLNVLPRTSYQAPTSVQPFPYNTNNPPNVFPPTISQAPTRPQPFLYYPNNPPNSSRF